MIEFPENFIKVIQKLANALENISRDIGAMMEDGTLNMELAEDSSLNVAIT